MVGISSVDKVLPVISGLTTYNPRLSLMISSCFSNHLTFLFFSVRDGNNDPIVAAVMGMLPNCLNSFVIARYIPPLTFSKYSNYLNRKGTNRDFFIPKITISVS